MMVEMLAEIKKSYECFIRSEELESAIVRHLLDYNYVKVVENLLNQAADLILKI